MPSQLQDYEQAATSIREQGYAISEGVLDEQEVAAVKQELVAAIDAEVAYHGTTDFKDYGMLLAAPLHGGRLLSLVENERLMGPFNVLLQETCIVHVYTSSSIPPGRTNYGGRIHNDRPKLIPGQFDFHAAIIALDDFTEANGATRFLPGSQIRDDEPNSDEFAAGSVLLEVKAGSVFYFDTRLWHSGGDNKTSSWRHSLALGMTSPYVKQKIDLPRALKDTDTKGLSQAAMQKLGFFAQPPVSLDEYYAPREKRPYRQVSY